MENKLKSSIKLSSKEHSDKGSHTLVKNKICEFKHGQFCIDIGTILFFQM